MKTYILTIKIVYVHKTRHTMTVICLLKAMNSS